MPARLLRGWLLAGLLVALLCLTPVSWALVNPKLTPIHLVGASETILSVKVKNKDFAKAVELEIVAALKGEAPKGLTVDLSKAAKEQAEAARKLLTKHADEPALLFLGKGPDPDNPDQPYRAGFLHVHGQWLTLTREGDAWSVEAVDSTMLGTWNGGTDMLTRCVRYIVEQKEAADVPVQEGFSWASVRKVGQAAGRVFGMATVDLAGDGKPVVHVATDKGDMLLAPTKDGLEDITGKTKLKAASRCAAWSDYNGDGRLDLASFDGAKLAIWTQAADGTFAEGNIDGLSAPADCVGLAVTGQIDAKLPALVVSCASGKVLVTVPGGKTLTLSGKADGLGKGGAAIVADFNNDGLPDIIQPFEKGGLIYLGAKDGAFAPAKPCPVCTGAGGGRCDVADFDGDGALDVVSAGVAGPFVFQNAGDGTFTENLAESGEIAYKAQPRAVCGVACDFTGDARPDVLLAHADQPMLFYFNRGFRSFAQAPALASGLEEIPDFNKGQQMALMGDFRQRGAQDLLVAANNGELWLAANSRGEGKDNPCIRAVLPLTAAAFGPVNVTLWEDKCCLCVLPVRAGEPSIVSVPEPGAFTLKWQLPGKPPTAKRVKVIDAAVKVVVE